MKATFNFNVQIDGYKSVVTMDGQDIENLEVEALVVLGKLFRDVQERVNKYLEKMYTENKDCKKTTEDPADTAGVNTQEADETPQEDGKENADDSEGQPASGIV